MATVRTVLDTLVIIVESVTPDTVYDGSRVFKHDELTYDADDATDHQSPTRRFVITLTGDRTPGGAHGASGSPIHVTQVFQLAVVYRLGSSGSELFRVVAEDVDRIGFEVLRPAQWDQSNSGISRMTAGAYGLEMSESAGGAAVLALPITVHYKPSFTG